MMQHLSIDGISSISADIGIDVEVSYDVRGTQPGYSMVPGTGLAMIPVVGVLATSGWFGNTIAPIVRAVLMARADPMVKAACLCIDSPGGSVAGVDDMLAALRELAAVKPLHAATSTKMTSLGYWPATAAREIVATPNAIVGSIGVVSNVMDSSKMYENEGLRSVSFASGQQKTLGMPGVPITDEMAMREQAMVDDMAGRFFADVSASRGISVVDVQAMQGAAFTGAQGVANKLVTRIVPSMHSYLRELATLYATNPQTPAQLPLARRDARAQVAELTAGAPIMADDIKIENKAELVAPVVPAGPVAATAAQLKASIGDGAFCFEALSDNLTLEQAQAKFIAHLRAIQVAEAATTAKALASVAPHNTGIKPTATGTPAPVIDAKAYLAACGKEGADPVELARVMLAGMPVHIPAVRQRQAPVSASPTV